MYSILIVNKEQYGYHIDTYKYCVNLSDKFKVTYLCWDENKSKVVTDGINCIYLEKKGQILKRFYILISQINKEIKKGDYNLIFINYFFGCSLAKILNFDSVFNLDIRTIAVTKNKFKNFIYDKLLIFESSIFKNITVISEETAKQIRIKKSTILPLGGECLVKSKIDFKNLNLIYVGTLSNRNIMDLVKGFKIYLEKYPIKRNTTLTLIGDGYNNELEELRQFVKSNNLNNRIITTGYIQNTRLIEYFTKANCGVSFIPITPYYQNQPPTKTYEYLLSGLPVLATNTNANKKIINKANGILIEDNSEAVAKGIYDISEILDLYNSKNIRKEMEDSLWENIVNKILSPYFKKIIRGNK